ncbi:MAG: hypothetical protein IPP18_04265 [Rhodocyclaceae bacterium]|jgi:3-oxoacyl-[acyl-carrier-protein] synthase-3|nr:hypothetical protein [Rhodocyclaceae bacterium]MBK6554148.1 hypothetical protein [Rhodocyclaceae bacterium]MBK9310569.1 hypothetical protein [Rhodocyclaceae bacterium]MBK9954360.1 hypothetical protein [Rhodocyclaceae bacterium]
MKNEYPLAILGTGIHLPPAQAVRETAAAAGADVSAYQGWDRVCLAGDNDHPSTMGAAALRAALADCGVDGQSLRLVIFAGISRDYLPSFSVATEIMKECGAGSRCLGIDLTIGCLGALSGLDFAQGWLATHGGGLAAVVAAERWAYTVDRSSVASMGLWAHGDGAGAIVVGMDAAPPAKAIFAGAEMISASDLNGLVLVKYGGTRNPVAPPGSNPGERIFLGVDRRDEIRDRYLQGYSGAYAALKERFGIAPDQVVCNQTAAQFVQLVSHVYGIAPERVVVTGHQTGHVGAADLIVGMDTLLKRAPLTEPCLLAGSTPYAFGCGLLLPPA